MATFGGSRSKVIAKPRRIVTEETKLPPVVIKNKSQLSAYPRRSNEHVPIPLISPISTKNVIKEAEEQELAIDLFIRTKRRQRATIEKRNQQLEEHETNLKKKAEERQETINTNGGKAYHFDHDGSQTQTIIEIKPIQIEKLPDWSQYIDLDLTKELMSSRGMFFK